MKAIWSKKDYPKKKNGYKVYSCFACGGGSTMGYKLAGFDVIGANDIDPQMAEIYQKNHSPKHYHLMDIRSLVLEKNLPEEMFDLDILDGSPPCSSFSMAGSREEKWGEKKKFREGQAEQTLDDLFFDFIDLAKRLQPKIVIAENVKGLISGNAKQYVIEINEAFQQAGYDAQLFLLNGSNMGVPQRRERVFFIARRKDLKLPKITLDFNEAPVFFKDIRTDAGLQPSLNPETKMYGLWKHRKKSDSSYAAISHRIYGKKSYFSENIVHDDKVCQTIVSGSGYYLYDKAKHVSSNDLISIQSFPQDYDFVKNSHGFIKYVLGMSVPPLMTAGVAKEVEKQLLSHIVKG
jgi:DNA (cytosine-5)-methyltransferase 1